jgi:predicted hotdog family 3-hydroxylacyl-ACP dehydratase
MGVSEKTVRPAAAEVATKEAAAEAATNMRQAAGTAPMPEQAAAGAAAPVRPQEDPLETNPLELIPQRPPMVLVDRFEGIDAEGVSTTGYTVEPAGLFVAGGRMSECGIIEHMAQSAAARIGWCCRAEGRPVPVGFIGAVSRLELHDLPRTGVHLRTRLRIVQEIGPLSLAEVRTEADGRPLAEGNLKIYLQS